MTVWPFVGFVQSPSRIGPSRPDEPFLSLDIDNLRESTSKTEVATAFHLPLAALVEPTRRRQRTFRYERPYWAIAVTDLVPQDDDNADCSSAAAEQLSNTGHIDGRQRGVKEGSSMEREDIEVWGLTGWYLSLLMKVLRIYE
ncbi:hypothetical protein AX17_003606 [Amanita inopinata Kibby_2008]|nr:hypothetical protein AX17_003606 [Amanita inopinata Kibby_2008]